MYLILTIVTRSFKSKCTVHLKIQSKNLLLYKSTLSLTLNSFLKIVKKFSNKLLPFLLNIPFNTKFISKKPKSNLIIFYSQARTTLSITLLKRKNLNLLKLIIKKFKSFVKTLCLHNLNYLEKVYKST